MVHVWGKLERLVVYANWGGGPILRRQIAHASAIDDTAIKLTAPPQSAPPNRSRHGENIGIA